MARTEIRLGKYVLDVLPVVFIVLTAMLCGQFQRSIDINDDAMKLVKDLNRQRTAAEMRALRAEKKAAKQEPGTMNVIVIQPEKQHPHQYPERIFADVSEKL
ncbi:hypothetical protein ACEZG4_001508 [Enterobacter kobei]